MTGRVVHFEIPCDDRSRAASFYTAAFGWNNGEIPDMNYTIAGTGPVSEQGMPSEPGYINGGMFTRDSEYPATPVITIDVPDIDAALAKIGELGGSTVSSRMPVGEMGFAAYFKDTEGNVLGLWENAS